MSRTVRRLFMAAFIAVPISATAAEQPSLLSPADHGPAGLMADMAARWVLKHVYEQAQPDVQQSFEPKLVSRDSVSKLA